MAGEVRAVREKVGAIEIANFAKHEFKGLGAQAFLDRMLAAKLPAVGRLTLSPMLTHKGKLYGDLTVARLDEDTFYLFGSGAAQEMHRRWFEHHVDDTSFTYRNCSDDIHGIAISGPNSRELLSRIIRDDVSAEAFKFRDIRRTTVAGVPVILARLSFSGELGYEVYCLPQYQLKLFEQIQQAGRDLGLTLYGARTLMSLRLEKGWGVWTLDFRPDFTAAQSGLDAFIRFDKAADFIGKGPALTERQNGPDKKIVTLVMETDDIDVTHDEAIFHNGECVGYVTSGGFAHYVRKSVALGYVPPELAKDGETFEIELLGEMKPAKIVTAPLYDANGGKMRG